MELTSQRVVLALADGAIFEGRSFGAVSALAGEGRRGEVVFTTAMTGYQEVCTDPSYRGQMVVMTYPIIGNYGVARVAEESRRPWLSVLLVRDYCDEFSNWRATDSLDHFLTENGIPGIAELDTRALTRHLRDHGTQRAIARLVPDGAPLDREALTAAARAVRTVTDLDVVDEVSVSEIMDLTPHVGRKFAGGRNGASNDTGPALKRIVLIDTGYKQNIASCLSERGLGVTLAPHDISLAQLLALQPDGVLLSNGPGDPETVTHLIALTREIMVRQIPLMGICLGHQIVGLAAGARTSRLPFGHHGCNHPVMDLDSGEVTITSQNHNFQVDADSLPADSGFRVSHRNISDGSVEGLRHTSLPIFSVQYHPEAAPGPRDNRQLFDHFARIVQGQGPEESDHATQ
ncbi:MAG: glutamine-hydrolyzing carbamoyl-phosphate synthase small subunit [Ktedonobacterales bacterium]|nr:glutamine-hydrolyzing carbamoyl-phosphate synthase small subunit [Ktedonobacterales bacterium]